jgi:hypothetical protein
MLVRAAEVSFICYVVLGWKHYEVYLCKSLLVRLLFTCGCTFHLHGGVGLVCMNCVTDRPLVPPTIIFGITYLLTYLLTYFKVQSPS